MQVKSEKNFNYYQRVATLLHFHAFRICHYSGRELNKNLFLYVFLQSQKSVLGFSMSFFERTAVVTKVAFQLWKALRFRFTLCGHSGMVDCIKLSKRHCGWTSLFPG